MKIVRSTKINIFRHLSQTKQNLIQDAGYSNKPGIAEQWQYAGCYLAAQKIKSYKNMTIIFFVQIIFLYSAYLLT